MSNKLRSISALSVFLMGLVAYILPGSASAVPAFARQTGMSCTACHFQHFPTLNSFGRSFRAGGYTMVGGQSLIENDNTSLPMTLNMSMITKVRYNKQSNASYGDIQWPDEAAFLVGGRLSKSIGYLFEIGLIHLDAGILGHKVHFNLANVGGTNLSMLMFTTDALGTGYGFELLNTGAQRSQRPMENRKGFSAAQALGTATPATGLAFVASRHDFFINVSLWGPAFLHDNTTLNIDGLAPYIRAAYMPTVAGMDAAIGAQIWTGDVTVADATHTADVVVSTDAWIIDGQLQGAVGGMPLGFYASYGSCKAASASANGGSAFGCEGNKDKAFGLAAELGVIPNKLTLYTGFSSTDKGEGAGAGRNWTVGFNYMLAENVRLEIYYDKNGGSKGTASEYMIQFFAGY